MRSLHTQLHKQVHQGALQETVILAGRLEPHDVWPGSSTQPLNWNLLPVWNHVWLGNAWSLLLNLPCGFCFCLVSFTTSGNNSQKTLSLKLNAKLCTASCIFMKLKDSTLARMGPFSTVKLRSPVRMVGKDQARFHVCGWKSTIERKTQPHIALKFFIGGYPITIRRFKRKFSRKNEFSKVIVTFIRSHPATQEYWEERLSTDAKLWVFGMQRQFCFHCWAAAIAHLCHSVYVQHHTRAHYGLEGESAIQDCARSTATSASKTHHLYPLMNHWALQLLPSLGYCKHYRFHVHLTRMYTLLLWNCKCLLTLKSKTAL